MYAKLESGEGLAISLVTFSVFYLVVVSLYEFDVLSFFIPVVFFLPGDVLFTLLLLFRW